jgi:hypothetical protein
MVPARAVVARFRIGCWGWLLALLYIALASTVDSRQANAMMLTSLLPAVWVVASLCNAEICANDRQTSISPERYAFHSSCMQAIADEEKRRIWSNPNYHRECIRVWIWELPKS